MTLQRKGVITANLANMYLNANAKSEVVSQAIIGTTCIVKLNKKGWYNIQLPDTYLGWAPAETVRLYTKQDQPYASLVVWPQSPISLQTLMRVRRWNHRSLQQSQSG